MSIHNSFQYNPGTGSTDDDHHSNLDHNSGSGTGEGGVGKSQNASYEGFFDSADQYWVEGGSQHMSLTALNAERDKLAPNTEIMLNEYIAKINEWCDPVQAAQVRCTHLQDVD